MYVRLLFLSLPVLSVFFSHCSSYEVHDYDEGDPCTNKGNPGICKLITDCNVAVYQVLTRNRHKYQRCGFKGMVEIICCPQDTNSSEDIDEEESGESESLVIVPSDNSHPNANVRAPTFTRQSEQACEQFSKDLGVGLSYHIVGGEDAELGEFPHMAALGYLITQDNTENGSAKRVIFNCGGSLISNRFVLTAAHCIANAQRNPPVVVRMGTVKINMDENVYNDSPIQFGMDYGITTIFVHPEYRRMDKVHDIALIELNATVPFNTTLHPACLYTKSTDTEELLVTGWGSTSLGGDKSSILQKATLQPVPLTVCNETYALKKNTHLLKSQLCASNSRSDACQGDSGGPAQIQLNDKINIYSIVGVTSYGIGCGSKYPGIYTRVSSYLDWIESIVWPI